MVKRKIIKRSATNKEAVPTERIPPSPVEEALAKIGGIYDHCKGTNFEGLLSAEMSRFMSMLKADPNLRKSDPKLFGEFQKNINFLTIGRDLVKECTDKLVELKNYEDEIAPELAIIEKMKESTHDED